MSLEFQIGSQYPLETKDPTELSKLKGYGLPRPQRVNLNKTLTAVGTNEFVGD